MDNIPEQGDEADVPIIVPRPGQILRRAARTKIRKAGTGEGPHRFTSSRALRGSAGRAGTLPLERTSDDLSSSDHGDDELQRRRSSSDAPELPFKLRPDSYSEESSIYDAYAREDSDEADSQPPLLVSSPETPEFQSVSPPPPQPPESMPIIHQPQPKRVLSPPPADDESLLHRSPSPETTPVAPVPPVPPLPPTLERPQAQRPHLAHQSSSYQTPPSPSTSPGPSDHRREKDKKGLFGKWGGDKGSKKGHSNHREKEKEKEKDGSFFGSLFGGKKKQDEGATPPMGGMGNAGRETAAALLGSSKSAKAYAPSPSPQPIQGYARYPIHVERAIYRLSHIKLANPRRPLYEQVLISNLMFWYLGVINKTPAPASPSTPNAPGAGAGKGEGENAEQVEQEKREREEKERAEKERLEKEREREREKEREKGVESKRKGSLTKSPTPGTPGARRAETPVRGPQYDMQHRAMEQEYVYQGAGQPVPRTSSSAPPPMNYSQQGARGGSPGPYSTVQLVQPQPQLPQNRYYNPSNGSAIVSQPYLLNQQPGAPQLPPGAMPPIAVEQAWINSSPGSPVASRTASPPRVISPSSTNSRTTSPPTAQRYSPQMEKIQSAHGRAPGRSLSASATPQHRQVNGTSLSRKGNSAHAVSPGHRVSEEEDVPLAVYQQRRK